MQSSGVVAPRPHGARRRRRPSRPRADAGDRRGPRSAPASAAERGGRRRCRAGAGCRGRRGEQRVGLVGVDEAAEAGVRPRGCGATARGTPAGRGSSRAAARRAGVRDLVVDRDVAAWDQAAGQPVRPRRRGRGRPPSRRCRRAGRAAARPPSQLAPAAGHDHDLDAGPQARLERPHAEQREAASPSRQHARPGRAAFRRGRRRRSAPCEARPGACGRIDAMAIAQTEPWSALLDAGRADGRLVREAFEGARAAAASPSCPHDLHPSCCAGAAAGRDRGALHPSGAGARARVGGPTIVTTGTASGKSLCFNLPTLDVLLRRPARARAVPVPDQGAGPGPGARAARASGCTSRAPGDLRRRHAARGARARSASANLVLTNPDMLHVGILPNHRAWGDFFANLAVVVVDEAHVYRGVFGSHVANVLRRLRRIAAAYGTDAALPARQRDDRQPGRAGRAADRPGRRSRWSTTTARPARAAQIAMWNPPVARRGAADARAARSAEAADMVAELVREGARTICFIKSRKAVELIAKLVADDLARRGARAGRRGRALPRRLHPAAAARARGAADERRAAAPSITTDALELGIDIGALDAAVCVTFPGTVASLRQMWGRAGRRGRGLAVYVAGEDALDQFFCRHPDEFLERPVEAAILDHENEQIHLGHLLCAAHEGPLDPERRRVPRAALARARRGARRARRARRARAGASSLRQPEDYPAARVVAALGLAATRSPSSTSSSGEMLGTVEAARACIDRPRRRDLPAPGPLVRGRASSTSTAAARSSSRSTATGTRSPSARPTPRSSGCSTAARRCGVTLCFGTSTVTEQVLAYQRKRLADHEVIDLHRRSTCRQTDVHDAGAVVRARPRPRSHDFPLDAAARRRCTRPSTRRSRCCRCWRCATAGTSAACRRTRHPQTGGPTIFIYDGHPGGVGITRQGFRASRRSSRDATG